ncbi:sensor histidine kinase [Bacillota bacterium Lsc_1132]
MFQKTHIRLTAIISLVFIVLISILGSIVYFYTQHQLYKDVNRSLIDAVGRFQQQDPPPREGFQPLQRRDPRVVTLFWNEKKQLLKENREADLFLGNEKQILPKVKNHLTDIDVGDFAFRYLAVKVNTNIGEVTVQAIRNINSEKELLDRLLVIMLVGVGIGILCAVGAGYFLAGKALIPIKKAWQKQQQFVSDASHELRTPLAVIQSKTDVLFRTPTKTIQEQILDISTISNEARRLSKLVANLLTLARSDSDQIEVKKTLFLLDELLKEIQLQYEDIVEFQGKKLLIEARESIPFFADKERIHQLIVILLDNAIKFTNDGGKIKLSCAQMGSSILLKIEDNGIGIAKEDVGKIFDRFYQGDKSRTNAEGTGLGLSIAKWIIEKHHGKTKVNSTPGEGTAIEIQFPRSQK